MAPNGWRPFAPAKSKTSKQRSKATQNAPVQIATGIELKSRDRPNQGAEGWSSEPNSRARSEGASSG